uniref:DUF3306 domain-containing protein n=1 Tax=Ramlibacter cellulosilyticus TaxID=2764187 RepID=A0A923S9L8_9BURK|nr:DUF3306 domain-containing protein [Ramlibacter cellulosilyticus]MBC5781811.1 DUF3306 domain-containing protein [Ramlibacter cellulosilyticus]
MAEGFFSRWSQRKDALRKGQELPEEPKPVSAPERPSPPPSPRRGEGEEGLPLPLAGEGRGEGQSAPEPPPTLEDAQALTKDSDFTRFARPDVAPEVKNTAMKKLFSDPHFNTMDGLDVYIDDYNKPDPLPPDMLRKLASAKFLKLFDDEEEEKDAKSPTAGESPDAGAPESVAQSSTRTAQALPPAEDHADPDLRLQQDDAPGPESPGAGSR